MATTQTTRNTPIRLEAAYFRWIGAGAEPTATERAERIFRHHLALAEARAADTASVRVYRPTDDTALGAAIQIVNDDMPMLVDAVTATLRRSGVTVDEVMHPVFDVLRDARGRLQALTPHIAAIGERSHSSWGTGKLAESWIHLQLGADTDEAALADLEATLPTLLTALRQVHRDTPAMLGALTSLADRLGLQDGDAAECADLLRWLADDNFTFLGYTYRWTNDTGEQADGSPDTNMGVLRDGTGSIGLEPTPDNSLLRVADSINAPLVVGSLQPFSIGIADPAESSETGGRPRGEHIFTGAFSLAALHDNVLDIPVLSRRARQVVGWAGFAANSYSGQAMTEIMQSLPRAELFVCDPRQLFETVSAIANLGLRRQVRLFLRPDPAGTIVHCLVYMPRDRYSTEVRERMRDLLRTEFHGTHVGYSARASESELAVVNFTVHRRAGQTPPDTSEATRDRIQHQLFDAALTWADRVVAASADHELPSPTVQRYAAAFPANYRHDAEPSRALDDIQRLEQLDVYPISTHLHPAGGDSGAAWRFTLYVRGDGISLSRVLPVLHSLGVEVIDERPYRIDLPDQRRYWIYDFGLCVRPDVREKTLLGPQLDDRSVNSAVAHSFCDAFEAMWFDRVEIDTLNELVLRAGLSWRATTVLRGYAKYLRQARFPYGPTSIARVLSTHPAVARSLHDLFTIQFDPDTVTDTTTAVATVRHDLEHDIDRVEGLDADRILRALLNLIAATTRTNYFRRDIDGRPRDYLALKFDAATVLELPEPRPQREIFVYSPRTEGVHLRFGPVARGGLRWSDRLDDFRTEILGLVKAQAVKNAVIVPVGAKGGFVVKRPPLNTADRAALNHEAIACYREFISGLLDLTDNIDPATRAVLPPDRVVRRDGDDSYLVVAADKGTATFSDIANDVAARYGFWFGDAFASGGSSGYDHKAMGITAKGAWESVKRHCTEMGFDITTETFTVAGVGDMSGDVFGNGMLLSDRIALIAAFDHRHIFLDPTPDPATAHRERARLFTQPRSSWTDYDPTLISPGGGVYDRASKTIAVTAQIRAALRLDSTVTALSPPQMIQAILRAPVDLLWNGGIGTYVKASSESHTDVGDKSNDAVRVDAHEVRAKVIGEGGNLGVTPLGRVEYSRLGGRINSDALDNSAGVDCSDHEVNIKIVLETAINTGTLDIGERDALLSEMTDDVAELVLRDNISQNIRLGLSRADARSMVHVHRQLLDHLEDNGLDRELEALPTDVVLRRRITDGGSLTSPELATLMAHVKLSLKSELLQGDLPDNTWFESRLLDYFPTALRDRFATAIRTHPLRREIIATTMANEVVDNAGITFVFEMAGQTGTEPSDAVRAFFAAAHILDLPSTWHRIRTEPMPITARDQLELETTRTLDHVCRWLLSHRPQPIAIGAEISRYRNGVQVLAPRVPGWLSSYRAEELTRQAHAATALGAPARLAEHVYGLTYLYQLLDVLDIAEIADRDRAEVAELSYSLGDHLDLERLLTAADEPADTDRWNALAHLAIRDDLHGSLRALTLAVLDASEPADEPAEKIRYWESTNRARIARARTAVAQVFTISNHDLARLSIAARQVRAMAGASSESRAIGAAHSR